MYEAIRAPTAEEAAGIAAAIANEEGRDLEDAVLSVAQYEPIILDGYISDGPGYVGRVAVMVWGEPLFVTVYCWYEDDVDGGEWRAEDVNERSAPEDEGGRRRDSHSEWTR